MIRILLICIAIFAFTKEDLIIEKNNIPEVKNSEEINFTQNDVQDNLKISSIVFVNKINDLNDHFAENKIITITIHSYFSISKCWHFFCYIFPSTVLYLYPQKCEE